MRRAAATIFILLLIALGVWWLLPPAERERSAPPAAPAPSAPTSEPATANGLDASPTSRVGARVTAVPRSILDGTPARPGRLLVRIYSNGDVPFEGALSAYSDTRPPVQGVRFRASPQNARRIEGAELPLFEEVAIDLERPDDAFSPEAAGAHWQWTIEEQFAEAADAPARYFHGDVPPLDPHDGGVRYVDVRVSVAGALEGTIETPGEPGAAWTVTCLESGATAHYQPELVDNNKFWLHPCPPGPITLELRRALERHLVRVVGPAENRVEPCSVRVPPARESTIRVVGVEGEAIVSTILLRQSGGARRQERFSLFGKVLSIMGDWADFDGMLIIPGHISEYAALATQRTRGDGESETVVLRCRTSPSASWIVSLPSEFAGHAVYSELCRDGKGILISNVTAASSPAAPQSLNFIGLPSGEYKVRTWCPEAGFVADSEATIQSGETLSELRAERAPSFPAVSWDIGAAPVPFRSAQWQLFASKSRDLSDRTEMRCIAKRDAADGFGSWGGLPVGVPLELRLVPKDAPLKTRGDPRERRWRFVLDERGRDLGPVFDVPAR